MEKYVAALLTPELAEQAKRIGDYIRQGEVAPLIGAGVSVAAGLPDWETLVRRMASIWCAQSGNSDVQRFYTSAQIVLRSNLAVASILRDEISQEAGHDTEGFASFEALAQQALYLAEPNEELPQGGVFTPTPAQLHRQLVALFSDQPGIMWTTNYDDLLEAAAKLSELPVHSLDSLQRSRQRGLAISHIHGLLRPVSGTGVSSDALSPIVMGEDDYHQIASDSVGWTNRELVRLFDDYRVLVFGMSLDDPNLRRVLRLIEAQEPAKRYEAQRNHYAVIRPINADDLLRPSDEVEKYSSDYVTMINDPDFLRMVNERRIRYWERRGLELVALPTHDHLLPFLLRLRYESYGEKAGRLWERAGDIYTSVTPWEPRNQGFGRDQFSQLLKSLKSTYFDLGSEEDDIYEVGLFLVKPNSHELELVFNSQADKELKPGYRILSCNPDNPTGVAGRVFVSGDMVRISTSDPLFDYGLPEHLHKTPSYGGILAMPVVDWLSDALPIGVVYITTKEPDGDLFKLQEKSKIPDNERTIESLYSFLQEWIFKFPGALQ